MTRFSTTERPTASGQRAGHDAVDRALGLVRQRVPALTRDRARRPEREAARRGARLAEQPAQQAGVVLLVLAGRRRRLVRHCSPPGSARGAQPTWPPPTPPGAAAPRAARDPTAARSAPSCRATLFMKSGLRDQEGARRSRRPAIMFIRELLNVSIVKTDPVSLRHSKAATTSISEKPRARSTGRSATSP